MDIRKLEFYFVRDTFLTPKYKKAYTFWGWLQLELFRFITNKVDKDLFIDLSSIGQIDLLVQLKTYGARLENNKFPPFINVD